MANALTADIYNGIEVSFKDFMMKCAMDIDHNYQGELEGGTFPKYEPKIEHLHRQLDMVNEQIEKLKNSTVEEIDAYLEVQFQTGAEMYDKHAKEKKELELRYQDMLDRVDAWNPPTPQHIKLKEYAMKQLVDSIEHDCTISYTRPSKEYPEVYRTEMMEFYNREIAAIESRIKRNIASCENSNKWNNELLASLDV